MVLYALVPDPERLPCSPFLFSSFPSITFTSLVSTQPGPQSTLLAAAHPHILWGEAPR